MIAPYTPDRSLVGKLRRRVVGLHARRPAPHAPERGMVSFSFDDVPASAAEEGAAVLRRAGVRGTFFIASGLCGGEGHMGRFANREQVAALAAEGHEIGCHTRSHGDLARVSEPDMAAELDANHKALAECGAPAPATFAYPYGEVGFAAKRVAGGRFALARTVTAGLVRRGSDLAQAPSVGLEGEAGEAVAARWIDRAAASGAWLILFTHDVRARPSPWGCTPETLERTVALALARGLRPVTVAEGARAVGDAA